MHGSLIMYIILSKELQKILLTAFSDSLEITLDVVINIIPLNATEYILFYFKNLQYHYEVTYWGFYLIRFSKPRDGAVSHLLTLSSLPTSRTHYCVYARLSRVALLGVAQSR